MLTKLRSRPSSVYKCLRRSPYVVVSCLSASPTVAALNSTLDCLPAKGRNAVGISSLIAIVRYPPKSFILLYWRGAYFSRQIFWQIMRTVVRQPPRKHFPRLASGHGNDHVAVPRPRMLAIEFAGPRRMIGMRM